MAKEFYKRVDFGDWMKQNSPSWKDTTLAKKLTEMGTPITHTAVWYWRNGQTKPKGKEMLKNLTYLAGFRAELFFLTESQETRLKELSENYDKDAALKLLFE